MSESETSTDQKEDLRCSGSVLENFHCSWKIDKFSSLDRNVGAVYSTDTLPTVEKEDVPWIILLFPGGKELENKRTVQCYLAYENKLNGNVQVKCNVAIRKSDNKAIVCSQRRNWTECEPGDTFLLVEIPRKVLLGRIEDDVVIITAEILYSRSIAKAGDTTVILGEVSPYATLVEDFCNLSKSMVPDVIIAIGETEIPAHSVVLSARSEVFADMLRHDADENNRIEIVDFNADLVKAMVYFMYSGAVNELNKPKALDLIQIGHKYHLDGLVSHCTNFLNAQLDVSNMVQLTGIVDFVSCGPEFREQAVEYICENVSANDLKGNYSVLINNPDLLFDAIVRKKELRST